MASVAWFVALRDAKHSLAVLARDPMLTSEARSRASMLSSAHPSAELVELIAANPPLCYAKWRSCLVETSFLISALATFQQGSRSTRSMLRLAKRYPTIGEIKLLCNRQCGYAGRIRR
jgi:hypothetical protein